MWAQVDHCWLYRVAFVLNQLFKCHLTLEQGSRTRVELIHREARLILWLSSASKSPNRYRIMVSLLSLTIEWLVQGLVLGYDGDFKGDITFEVLELVRDHDSLRESLASFDLLLLRLLGAWDILVLDPSELLYSFVRALVAWADLLRELGLLLKQELSQVSLARSICCGVHIPDPHGIQEDLVLLRVA